MNLFKSIFLTLMIFLIPEIGNCSLKTDLDVIKLQSCKKVNIEEIHKALSYCDNPLNWSTLNYAIEMRDYKSALLIVDYANDINHKDSAYSFDLKSQKKITALERVLFIAYFNEKQKSLTYDQLNLIKKLINAGADFKSCSNTEMNYPIIYLCHFNEIELVSHLLDLGFDINKENGRLLSLSICKGYTELVKLLIQKGANFNLINMLNDAIISQKCELAQLALDLGFDITKIDAVNIAINYTLNEVRSLNNQISLNIQYCYDLPALEMVHFLLVNGANPNFWLTNPNNNIDNAFSTSPLSKALNLLDSNPSCMQEWYQHFLIGMLLEFGAVIP